MKDNASALVCTVFYDEVLSLQLCLMIYWAEILKWQDVLTDKILLQLYIVLEIKWNVMCKFTVAYSSPFSK